MTDRNSNNAYIIATVIAVIVIVFLMYSTRQEQETPGTRMGNAMEEMADGLDDAADELKPNKTVGEKLGDAVEDAGDSIKDATRE